MRQHIRHIPNQAFLDTCTSEGIKIQHTVSLRDKSSFCTGGTVAYFNIINSDTQLAQILCIISDYHMTPIVLGGGSNVLPPDNLLDAVILSTKGLQDIHVESEEVICGTGISVRTACVELANRGKRGLDFLYGMPGTIGGALYMNARCYNNEISEILVSASGYNWDGTPWHYKVDKADFSYKQSPFKDMGIITECTLRIYNDKPHAIWQDMLSHEMDRKNKGHYLAPCAGSVFKNNHTFGSPSGTLLDTLEWRNKIHGGARVNPYHANIIINDNDASAQDIYELSMNMKESVLSHYGFELEHELIFLGEKKQWKR